MSTGSPGPEAWSRACSDLADWHASRDRLAANRALSYIESSLRTRIPSIVRRRWAAEEIDDAIQGFLERLLNKPLPSGIHKPDAYLNQAFRRWCIDRQRGRKGDIHQPWDDSTPAQSVQQNPADRQRLDRATQALEALRVEDRVVIKLVQVPQALTWEELSWLAKRGGVSAHDIRSRGLEDLEMLELSLIFDPGARPETPKQRRDRLERFRRRRNRARDKLRQRMGEAQ